MFKDRSTLLTITLTASIIGISVVGTHLISQEGEMIDTFENDIYTTNREVNATLRNIKEFEEIVSFLDKYEYSREYFDSSLNLLHQLKSLEHLMFKHELNNITHDINNMQEVEDFVEGSIETSVKAPLNNILSFVSELYDINPSPYLENIEVTLDEEEFLSNNSKDVVANINLIFRSKNKDLSSFRTYDFKDISKKEPKDPFGYYTITSPKEDQLKEYADELKASQENGNKEAHSEIQTIVETEANKAGVDKDLVLAIIQASSNFNPQITLTENRVEYRGLMGINPEVAPWFAEKAGLEYKDGIEYDIESNIRMGVFYLSHLKANNSNVHHTLSSFHYGPEGAEEVMDDKYESAFSRRVMNAMKDSSWDRASLPEQEGTSIREAMK
ncbi:transglycosylase SLT domain-containing protein (plasmid) [Rossellomorea sp. AcN35-11]|nr:transglycosylase SLT domain-containing protein [Rossellomorea aquimaris]WJV32320.1 transglycosylase SLT domain-containing protein [Rossellomorea sp. AcN35-11]